MENKNLIRRMVRMCVNKTIARVIAELIPWVIVAWVLSVAASTITTIYFINHPA